MCLLFLVFNLPSPPFSPNFNLHYPLYSTVNFPPNPPPKSHPNNSPPSLPKLFPPTKSDPLPPVCAFSVEFEMTQNTYSEFPIPQPPFFPTFFHILPSIRRTLHPSSKISTPTLWAIPSSSPNYLSVRSLFWSSSILAELEQRAASRPLTLALFPHFFSFSCFPTQEEAETCFFF